MRRIVVVLLVTSLVACQKDEFSSAPSVSAPEGDQNAAPLQEANSNLPANHPPTGGTPLAQQGAAVKFTSPAEFGKNGPLRWVAPESWTASAPASSMRLAEYVIPPVEGSQAGELSIFYFGAAGGGGVTANVTRWIGQFAGVDGAAPTSHQSEEMINGMKVHRVDAAGTFNPGMSGNGVPRENHRMLGAIVESSAGLYFFKLVAPADTIGARQAEFEAFVKSFSPGT